MNKLKQLDRKKLMYICLGIVTLALITALVVFAVTQSGDAAPKTEPEPSPTASASPTPPPSPTPTATPSPEPTASILLPPNSSADPSSGSDIILHIVQPSTETDIP